MKVEDLLNMMPTEPKQGEKREPRSQPTGQTPQQMTTQQPVQESGTAKPPIPQPSDRQRQASSQIMEQLGPNAQPSAEPAPTGPSPNRQQMMEEAPEPGEQHSALASFLMSGVDWGTFGTADKLAAVGQAVGEGLAEGDFSDFSEDVTQNQEDINFTLQESREEDPFASTMGAITGGIMGSLAPGALLNNIGKTFPMMSSWLARTATASVYSGGEAALYRWNSDGTAEEIAEDATLAALGGALLSGGAGLVGGLARKVRGTKTAPFERIAGTEMLRAINFQNATRGGATVGADDLLNRIDMDDPSNVIMDVYPEIARKFVKRAMASPDDTAGRRMLTNLLHTRNNVEIDFPTAVSDAVALPNTRSVKAFKQMTRQRMSRLGPKYDAILDGLDQRNITVKPSAINDGFEKFIASQDDASAQYWTDVQKLLKSRLNQMAIREGDEVLDRVSPRNIHNLKRDIGKMLEQAKPDIPKRGLRAAYGALNDILSDMDDGYAKLTRTYARAAEQEKAFEQGYKMFGATKTASDDFANFVESDKTYSEISAFTQGVRRQLYEQMRNKANNPTAIKTYLTNNQGRIENLSAVIGEERTNDLVNSVVNLVAREDTRRLINKTGVALDDAADTSLAKNLTDVAMSLLPGGTSPAGIRARARLVGPQATGGPAAQAAQADIYGQTLATPVTQQAELMKYLERVSRGQLPTDLPGRAATTAAGAGAGLVEGSQSGEEAEIMRYLTR